MDGEHFFHCRLVLVILAAARVPGQQIVQLRMNLLSRSRRRYNDYGWRIVKRFCGGVTGLYTAKRKGIYTNKPIICNEF